MSSKGFQPLENWLHKLNAATYEVDDILDEYKTKATRFLRSEYGRYHPKALSFRHKVGKRMNEVMKKLNAIAEERKNFRLHEKIIERKVARWETGPTLPEGQVYGRGKEEDEIVKILINNVSDVQELSVLPILGVGGLGKTTLLQMVFNDQRVIEHFDPKIWICVLDDFDEKKLIKAIVESIEGKPLGEGINLAPLQKKLQDLLKGKRYLLVLDDVWNEDQQKRANLRAVMKVGTSGASVLTTTRLEKVGSIMGICNHMIVKSVSRRLLVDVHATSIWTQEEINPNLVAIEKEIVKKCGGVPLAAKNLGGLLHFKREKREWEHVRDNKIWNLPQDDNSVLPALKTLLAAALLDIYTVVVVTGLQLWIITQSGWSTKMCLREQLELLKLSAQLI